MTNSIRAQRKSKQLTLEELADATSISVSHLSRIESGARGLNLKDAIIIARALGCDVTDITPDFSSDDIEAASKLNLTPKTSRKGDIPALNIHAGMGNGGLLSVEGKEDGIVPDEYLDGYWSFPDRVRNRFARMSRTYTIDVIGDSMEPTLPGGSVAFIDTGHTIPSPPDLYAVDYGDGLMVKRLELVPNSDKIKIISDNQRYSSYELLRSEVRVYGRMLADFRWRG